MHRSYFGKKDVKIKANKFSKIVLDSEHHLSREEKQSKREIHDLLKTFRELNEEIIQNRQEVELNCHEHFSDLRRQINIQREELKAKIDKIALDLITKDEIENEFYQELKEI